MQRINENVKCGVWESLQKLHEDSLTEHRYYSLVGIYDELVHAAPENKKPALLSFAEAAIRQAVNIKSSLGFKAIEREYDNAIKSVKKIVLVLHPASNSYGNLILWYLSFQSCKRKKPTDEEKKQMINSLILAAGESIAYYCFLTEEEQT